MRYLLFLIPIAAFAQAPLPTVWDARKNGAPTTGCKSSQDVGKRHSRINAAASNATLYVCQNTVGTTYAWGLVGSSLVTSVFGRAGAVAATSGDYTAAQVTNAADTTATYSNPAWITALVATKLTGLVPTANLGTGTASATTYLRGDGSWNTPATTTTVQAGSVGGVVATTAGSVVSLDSDPAFVMTQGGSNAPSSSMIPSAGIWNLASATSTNLKQGAADPATCTVGDLYTNTSGTPTLKLCTAANTWTSAGSSSSQIVYKGSDTTGACYAADSPGTHFTLAIPANILAVGDQLRLTGYMIANAAQGSRGAVYIGTSIVGGFTGRFVVSNDAADANAVASFQMTGIVSTIGASGTITLLKIMAHRGVIALYQVAQASETVNTTATINVAFKSDVCTAGVVKAYATLEVMR